MKMKLEVIGIAILLIIIAILCADGASPPLPLQPKKLQSPRASSEMVNEIMVREAEASAAPVRATQVQLNWTYLDNSGRALTLPRPDLVFDIFSSSNNKGWTLLATVTGPPYLTTIKNSQQMFRYSPRKL